MNNYHNIIQALKKAIQMEPGEPYKNRAIANAAFIALKLSQGLVSDLPDCADYNSDNKINVRDAAAIATHLASK
jgi:hypothetical protein